MRPTYRPHGPTRRAWLMLGTNGGPCDQGCVMCYYHHAPKAEKRWFHLDALKAGANRIRHYYGLEEITLSGGEPSILPGIVDLVRHCADIGLKPLINTHGANNTERFVADCEDAGLAHWIVSLQGMEAAHDAVTQRPGSWRKATANLANPKRPVLINTTATRLNMADLPALAAWLRDHLPPTVWHVLNFLPFGWEQHPGEATFAATLDEIGPLLRAAFDVLESAGWECNVQYYPLCVGARYGIAENVMTFYQGQWSPWDWDIIHTRRVTRQQIEQCGGVEATRRLLIDGVVKDRRNERCNNCRFQPICEMVPPGADLSVLDPRPGEPVTDIQHFEHGGEFA
jgi:MoaA/NifB/PqqE/SkfB family radical SAM enzyme